MRVPVIGGGDAESPRRPDLPEGVAYEVVEDHGDTMTVRLIDPEQRIAALEQDNAVLRSRLDSVAALADKANATAQEVAQAARDSKPPGKP
jgi:hypothetical protein